MSLEDEWRSFQREALHPEAPEEAHRVTKDALYIGASHVFEVMDRAMKDPAKTHEVFHELEALRVELQQHVRSLK